MARWVLRIAAGLAAALIGAVLVVLSCVTVNVPLRLFGPGENLELAALRRRLTLPDGFEIDYFAEDLAGPRFMRFTQTGDLLVSSPSSGAVLLLEPDRDGDAGLQFYGFYGFIVSLL